MATKDIFCQMRKYGRLLAGLALLLALGCGNESGPPRQPVSGRVTLDGQPLASGSITFLPAQDGPIAEGSIEEGNFAVGRSEGPGVGTYRVEIVSVQSTGKQVKSPDDPTATIEEARNVVPTRYNVNTELRAEVKPDGENTYHFELSSRKVASRDRRDRTRAARR